MGRDSSRSKGRGSGRGGGKRMFIQNVEELQMRDLQVGESRDARIKRRAGSDDEGEDKKDEFDDMEEGEEEGAKESVFAFKPKKAGVAAKKVGEAGEEEEEEEEKKPRGGLLSGIERSNPNHEKKAERSLKVKDLDGTPVPVDPNEGMNRKEREVIEAARKKEEYQRRHMAGETEGAQREIAQLAIVKARREAAAKQREAEGRKPGMSKSGIEEASDSSDSDDDDDYDSDDSDDKKKPAAKVKPSPAQLTIAAKKRAAAAGDEVKVEVKSAGKSKDSGPEKLKAMDIKKMNGDALKDHLKERKLDLQGQKKDLMQRLIDFEAARA